MIDYGSYCLMPNIGFVIICRNDLTKEILPIAVIQNGIAESYSGYGLMLKDADLLLESLKEWDEFNDQTRPIIKQAFMSFLVITYGKLFANAEGRKVKLDEKSLKNLPVELIDLHRSLIKLRNEYVAHGGKTVLEKCPVLLSNMKVGKENHFHLYSSPVYMNSLHDKDGLVKLVTAIKAIVRQKVVKAHDALKNWVDVNWNEDEFNRHAVVPREEDVFTLERLNKRAKNKN